MTLEEVMPAAARPEVRAVVEHRVRHAEIDGPDVVGDVADPVVLSAPAVLAKRDAPELVGSEAVAGFCCYALLLPAIAALRPWSAFRAGDLVGAAGFEPTTTSPPAYAPASATVRWRSV